MLVVMQAMPRIMGMCIILFDSSFAFLRFSVGFVDCNLARLKSVTLQCRKIKV
jgi:hypothetical protein